MKFRLAGFEALTVVMFQVEIFWVVTPCSVVGYLCFRGSCCLHLQNELARMGKNGSHYLATHFHHTTLPVS